MSKPHGYPAPPPKRPLPSQHNKIELTTCSVCGKDYMPKYEDAFCPHAPLSIAVKAPEMPVECLGMTCDERASCALAQQHNVVSPANPYLTGERCLRSECCKGLVCSAAFESTNPSCDTCGGPDVNACESPTPEKCGYKPEALLTNPIADALEALRVKAPGGDGGLVIMSPPESPFELPSEQARRLVCESETPGSLSGFDATRCSDCGNTGPLDNPSCELCMRSPGKPLAGPGPKGALGDAGPGDNAFRVGSDGCVKWVACAAAHDGVLDDAKRIINDERAGQYGPVENSFKCIADMWTAYIQMRHPAQTADVGPVVLSARDVAIMMALLKCAREANAPKRDNLVDLCGYGALAADLE